MDDGNHAWVVSISGMFFFFWLVGVMEVEGLLGLEIWSVWSSSHTYRPLGLDLFFTVEVVRSLIWDGAPCLVSPFPILSRSAAAASFFNFRIPFHLMDCTCV